VNESGQGAGAVLRAAGERATVLLDTRHLASFEILSLLEVLTHGPLFVNKTDAGGARAA
jgi:hypothetical protein